jgi:hypothetical protein
MTGSGTQAARWDPAVSREAANRHSNSRFRKGTDQMSEHKTNYMQELDRWTETTIIEPLADVGDEELYLQLVEKIKKGVREKILDSYRNGQKAGSGRREQRR